MPIQRHAELVVHDVRRAQRLLMLEFGDRKDFDDPRLEYRLLLGTLVLVATGDGILHAKGQISLAAAVVAPGLMVLAIFLLMGGCVRHASANCASTPAVGTAQHPAVRERARR